MGKQIRIYLADGSSAGIRHAEITNWSGQALACPRARFQELREWQEVKRPGIYFLVGQNDQTCEGEVYIGEAEVVVERLASHLSGKDFWSELIAFTSKDDNLTKGHIRYLESRLISEATTAGRYVVNNVTQPQIPVLPRGDRDAMEEYIESVKALLGVLGHRVLDPLFEIREPSHAGLLFLGRVNAVKPIEQKNSTEIPKVQRGFLIKSKNLVGTAVLTDEGLVVLKGSDATLEGSQSWPKAQQELRDRLTSQGVLVPNGSKYQFSKDHLFNSPSQAAGIVVGGSINGRLAWKLSDGITTFDAYEKSVSERLLREIGGETQQPKYDLDMLEKWQRDDRER